MFGLAAKVHRLPRHQPELVVANGRATGDSQMSKVPPKSELPTAKGESKDRQELLTALQELLATLREEREKRREAERRVVDLQSEVQQLRAKIERRSKWYWPF
jgi:vacuolar-type H+-ATPase subunit I/STV1